MGPFRSLRTLALAGALALVAGTGCFLGEIDKSMENYPGGSAAAKKEPDRPPAATPAGEKAAPAGPSWWATARTLGSEPTDKSIASCALGGRTEFMRRDDCLARGGRPQ